jgi:hypothetical protein
MISLAFPEYDTATLPSIPATWEDISWRNDVCPSWQFENFHIFINAANPDDRETGGERFSVCNIETGDCFLSSDNWNEILNYTK